MECFQRISDGSLSDIIIPSDQKNIKIEDSKDQIETETENSQGEETFINNNLEEPGTLMLIYDLNHHNNKNSVTSILTHNL